MKSKVKTGSSYGIAELYGESFVTVSNERRKQLLGLTEQPDCPHLKSYQELAPIRKGKPSILCGKKGGVCSIRSFTQKMDKQSFGAITATCPIRFYQNGLVFRKIGEVLLGNENAKIAKEIPFLIRPSESNSDNELSQSEDVGRIDMVLVDSTDHHFNWCAVELQAVYFSGGAISKDFKNIQSHQGSDVPMPGTNRRPDFRSSGPKRLMPQLQIKVPTLRRWGKKMAVVVDRPFFNSLGEMDHAQHVTNSDIIWFIVPFSETDGSIYPNIVVEEVRFTTLERAVEGLTAGIPTTLPTFEEKIREKLGR